MLKLNSTSCIQTVGKRCWNRLGGEESSAQLPDSWLLCSQDTAEAPAENPLLPCQTPSCQTGLLLFGTGPFHWTHPTPEPETDNKACWDQTKHFNTWFIVYGRLNELSRHLTIQCVIQSWLRSTHSTLSQLSKAWFSSCTFRKHMAKLRCAASRRVFAFFSSSSDRPDSCSNHDTIRLYCTEACLYFPS